MARRFRPTAGRRRGPRPQPRPIARLCGRALRRRAADGQVLDAGEKRAAMTVWRGVRAKSRAEGLENIQIVNGIHFYVVADAYRAAREENPEWPRGSDAQWSGDSGIDKTRVSTLSKLWETEKFNELNFRTWAEGNLDVSRFRTWAEGNLHTCNFRSWANGNFDASKFRTWADGNLNAFKFRTWAKAPLRQHYRAHRAVRRRSRRAVPDLGAGGV